MQQNELVLLVLVNSVENFVAIYLILTLKVDKDQDSSINKHYRVTFLNDH